MLGKSILAGRLSRDFVLSVVSFLSARVFPTISIPDQDLTGKTAVVTGANSGIGYSLALSLANRNATVYLACRSAVKAKSAAESIIDVSGSKNVHVLQLDVSLLSSVRQFVVHWVETQGRESKIDIFIHNAGIPSPPADSDTTTEGLNAIYATNFLGSFLLTSLLEPHLAPGARVVLTSSIASYLATFSTRQQLAPSRDWLKKNHPAPSMLYAYTKLDQIAFARLLQARFDMSRSPGQARRTAHAFSPGYSATTLFDRIPSTAWYLDIWFWFIKLSTKLATPIEQGAATGLWLATTDDPAVIGQGGGGGYWERLTLRTTTVDWRGGKSMQRLWDAWCRDSGASWQ